MYEAKVEPISPDADVIPRMGLYKVVILRGERFVRTDKENEIRHTKTKSRGEK